MKKAISLGFALLFTVATFSAMAQENKDVTEYKFDDDIVQGDLIRPDNTGVVVRRGDATKSLVKVRKHFVPEMFKSVENI